MILRKMNEKKSKDATVGEAVLPVAIGMSSRGTLAMRAMSVVVSIVANP
jgi:hypothetical protein